MHSPEPPPAHAMAPLVLVQQMSEGEQHELLTMLQREAGRLRRPPDDPVRFIVVWARDYLDGVR